MRFRAGSKAVSLVVTTVLLFGLVHTESAPASADVFNDPIRLIYDSNKTVGINVVSDNGLYGTFNTSDGLIHLVLSTGKATTLQTYDGYPSEDGWFVFGRGPKGFAKENLETGALTSIQIDSGIPFNSPWVSPTLIDVTADGRYQLLDVATADNFLRQFFVYDTHEKQLMTPPDGFGIDEPRIANARFLPGDKSVSYATFSVVGAPVSTFEILNFTTGTKEVASRPPENDPVAGTWTTSEDLKWVVFRSSRANVAPGASAATRLYRRNTSSGATSVVPVDYDTIDPKTLKVLVNGHVGYLSVVQNVDDYQLFLWNGLSAAQQLSRGVNAPANGPVNSGYGAAWTARGNSVLFLSFATNIVAGTPTDFARRLYRIGSPTSGLPIDNPAKALTQAERCSLSC